MEDYYPHPLIEVSPLQLRLHLLAKTQGRLFRSASLRLPVYTQPTFFHYRLTCGSGLTHSDAKHVGIEAEDPVDRVVGPIDPPLDDVADVAVTVHDLSLA